MVRNIYQKWPSRCSFCRNMCVMGINFVLISTIFRLDFGIILTACSSLLFFLSQSYPSSSFIIHRICSMSNTTDYTPLDEQKLFLFLLELFVGCARICQLYFCQSLLFSVVVCLLVSFSFAFVLSVFLRLTTSDYPLDIFRHFL